MKYALFIYNSKAESRRRTPEQTAASHQGYVTLGREMKARGVPYSGEVLHPVAAAKTVRVRGGKTVTTDGPFAETHEQLGGFYLIECQDLDEAIHWAAQIPAANTGSVEIRPVAVFE